MGASKGGAEESQPQPRAPDPWNPRSSLCWHMEPPSVPPEVSGLASAPSPHQPPPPSGPSGPCQAALQFQGVFLSPQRGAVTVLAQQAGSFGAGTGRGEGHQGLVPRSQVTFSGCPLPGPWRAERMRHEGDNSSNSGHSKPRCQLSRQHWSGSSLIPTNPQESGSSYGDDEAQRD